MERPFFTISALLCLSCGSHLPEPNIPVIVVYLPPASASPLHLVQETPATSAPVPSPQERQTQGQEIAEVPDQPCEDGASPFFCRYALMHHSAFCVFTVLEAEGVKQFYDCSEAYWEALRHGLPDTAVMVQCYALHGSLDFSSRTP